MGISKERHNAKHLPGGKSRNNRATPGRIVNFKPSSDHRRDLDEALLRGLNIWDVFERLMQSGHRLIVTCNPDNGSFCAMARDGNAEWDEAICVSIWSGGLYRSLEVLAFYLTSVNPEFPEGVQSDFLDDNHW